MALTQEEVQSVINAVISAIRTNSRMISQLTPVTTLSDTDSFEIGVGKRVAYSILNQLINAPNVEKAAQTDAALSRLAETDRALSERIGDEEVTRAGAVNALRDLIESEAERLAEDIANIDEYIIPQEIQPQIDYNRKAVDSLNDRIGAPTQAWENELGGPPLTMPGIAPLNESGVIAAKFLPSFVDDVMDFDGFVAWEGSFAGKEYKGDLSEVDHRVLFNPAAKRFILEVTPVSSTGKPQTPEYYPVWELEENQQLCLGAPTAVGYMPLTSKTYYCPKTTVSYRWNGTSLAPCGSHLELGKEVNTAYPGDAGKLLEEQKADRTELSPVLSRDPEEELETVEPDFLTLMLRKNEQVLTEAERRQVLENLGRPDLRLFIDMFNEAAGDDGYARMDNGVFDCKLNGVPLTYEEAIGVYASYPLSKHRNPTRQIMFAGSRDKTLFPINADSFLATSYLEAFTSCRNLVAVKFITASNRPLVPISNARRLFQNCESLKCIYGVLTFTPNADVFEAFRLCLSLEEVRIKDLAKSLNLESSPKLSLDSVDFMVQNAANTSPITITLHTDVFAKLTGELLAAAAEKNITLTTP